MQIYRIPALSDNYIFLIYDAQKNIAAVVDPAVAPPVLQKLEELGAELVAIFNTHHHSDHVGGNRSLMERFPNLIGYGGAEDRGRIPGQQDFLEEGDTVEFGDSRKGSASRNRSQGLPELTLAAWAINFTEPSASTVHPVASTIR